MDRLMAQHSVGREDLLKIGIARFLLGRLPNNPGVAEREAAALDAQLDACRRGEITPEQGLASYTWNQKALWVGNCAIADLPGWRRAFWRLVAVCNTRGQAGPETTSPYNNWWCGAFILIRALALRRGLQAEYEAAHRIARANIAMLTLGCGLVDGAVTYRIAGPRWHVGNPKGIAWAVARLYGLREPSWGAGKYELQYGESLLEGCLEFLPESEDLLTMGEVAAGQKWISSREPTPMLERLLAGLFVDEEIRLLVGDKGSVDSWAPTLTNCYDDPLPAVSWQAGAGPVELRWPGYGSSPLWPASSVPCEPTSTGYACDFRGHLERGRPIDERVEIDGHGEPVALKVTLNRDGVRIGDHLLPARLVEIPSPLPAEGDAVPEPTPVDPPTEPTEPQRRARKLVNAGRQLKEAADLFSRAAENLRMLPKPRERQAADLERQGRAKAKAALGEAE